MSTALGTTLGTTLGTAGRTPPIRLDLLKTGLFTVLGAELAPSKIGWGRGSVPQGQQTRDWASLQVLSGPTAQRQGRARGEVIYAVASAVITIDPAVREDDTALADVNGQRFRYDVPESADGESVRDALLAAIVLALGGYGVSAETVGTLAFVLRGAKPADLWRVKCGGRASCAVFNGPPLEFTSGQAYARVELQTFSKEPVTGAMGLATQAQTALLTPQVSEALFGYGLSLSDRDGAIADLSAIADGGWESRAAFTFGVTLPIRSVRPIYTIDKVRVAFGLDPSGAPIVLEATLDPSGMYGAGLQGAGALAAPINADAAITATIVGNSTLTSS